MNVNKDLFFVVNTLTKDEGHEMPKLTMLDNHEEMMKGRQKELNSLKEMGCDDSCERYEAVGKRAVQTRWVDREKDGRVKSKLVLKDYSRCQERTQPEMSSPTPSTLSLKTMLAASVHDRNSDPESDYITIATDVHTPFLHADVHEDLCRTTRTRRVVWRRTERRRSVETEQSIVRLSQSTKLWHQHLVSILESLNYHPLLADQSASERLRRTHIFSFMLMTVRAEQ